MTTLCIYHGDGCIDGFGAAWVVYRRFVKFGDPVEFHAASYGAPIPDVAGKDVLIVDFSYKRPVLEEMMATARTILILDHHKSAAEDLAGLNAPLPFEVWRRLRSSEPLSARVAALFDMTRSGAAITWDYLFPDEDRPRMIDFIQDRDLWQFKLPYSRELNDCLFSYPQEFEEWDAIAARFQSLQERYGMSREGTAIARKAARDMALILGMSTRPMMIGGQVVSVANVPRPMASDAANVLAEGKPFGATYFDRQDRRQFSLRSTAPDGADVALIAQRYGGGGHKHAAGFEVPLDWNGDQPV